MFHDYLAKYAAGGTQHLTFRLSVEDFSKVSGDLRKQGYAVLSEVDHPIARMAFFDTYQTMGVATEIMGVNTRRMESDQGDGEGRSRITTFFIIEY